MRGLWLVIVLLAAPWIRGQAQPRPEELLRGADVIAILHERFVLEAARQFVGFEILLANGNRLKITSMEGKLERGAAIFRLGIQATSSRPVNLTLTGRLGTGEVAGDSLRLPFQITDVALESRWLTGLLIKPFLHDWLKPGKWNEELPPLEIPLNLSRVMPIAPKSFSVEGSPPMEIDTPAYRPKLEFAFVTMVVLEGRAVIALRLLPSEDRRQVDDPDRVESGIEETLVPRGDLTLRLGRRVISRLLEQIAESLPVDMNLKLKPGRLRAEEVTVGVKVVNYTDVESGQGWADVTSLWIDEIDGSGIVLQLSGKGSVDARLRGREYGIPYRLSPRTTFTIAPQRVPLQLVAEGERVMLRAAPGTDLPLNLRFNFRVAGQEVGFNRVTIIQANRLINRVPLPDFLGYRWSLPWRLELDAGGNLYVTERKRIDLALSNVRIRAADDCIELVATAALTAP